VRVLFRITLTLLIALPMFFVLALFLLLQGVRGRAPAPGGTAAPSSERVGQPGEERTA